MSSKATPYVGPPLPMPREDMIKRRDRLAEVIPQLEADVPVLARKRGKDSADELQGKVKSLRARLKEFDAILAASEQEKN